MAAELKPAAPEPVFWCNPANRRLLDGRRWRIARGNAGRMLEGIMALVVGSVFWGMGHTSGSPDLTAFSSSTTQITPIGVGFSIFGLIAVAIGLITLLILILMEVLLWQIGRGGKLYQGHIVQVDMLRTSKYECYRVQIWYENDIGDPVHFDQDFEVVR